MATGAPDFYHVALTRGVLIETPWGIFITTPFVRTNWRLAMDGSLIPPLEDPDHVDPHWQVDDEGNLVPRSDLYPTLLSWWDTDAEGNIVPPG